MTHDSCTTHVSGPAAYSLPPMLAHNILVKSTAPSFSMYGRIKTGSFHEDMKRVLLKRYREFIEWLIVSFVFCHYMFAIFVFGRVPALLPTKLWTKLLILERLRRTAWRAETFRRVNLHRTQDLVLIVPKRCLFEHWFIDLYLNVLILYCLLFSLSYRHICRWRWQRDRLQVTRLAYVTQNTSIKQHKCRLFFKLFYSHSCNSKIITFSVRKKKLHIWK